MMKRATAIVFMINFAAFPLMAEPPKSMRLCAGQSCLQIIADFGEYIGREESGQHAEWRFRIINWNDRRITLEGTAAYADAKGEHQTLVVNAKPDVIRDGVAVGMAKSKLGRKSSMQDARVTWATSEFPLTGRWLQ